MTMTTLLICVVLALLLAWAIWGFNRLVRLRNQVRTAWADIDVQLTRRRDLVPSLVEDAWTRKFTPAVGAAAAAATTAAISWYHGGGVDNLGSLANAVGSSLSSQISSSSTPPGSSSGSGGGGSSGGGGGGGGGGGR